MFDVGFSELVVIALVALIVIGPERLPKVARTVGVLLGRLQRYVNDVKSDINREMQLDELKKIQENVSSQVRGLQDSVTSEMRSVEDSLNQSIAPPETQAAEFPAATPEAAGPVESASPAGMTDPVTHVPEHQLELGFESKSEKAKT
ncbi:MAG: Sec-independent protein translocase protein TatB [Proteobacteria bacterium]|nr:Sec-independent protein translocase protein TatB [Pseudomonadota bacterium]